MRIRILKTVVVNQQCFECLQGLWHCWLGSRKGILPVKNWVVGCWCGYLSGDMHMAQLMPLPLTVPCFSKIQIGFAFLVPAHPGSPRKMAVKRMCVCCQPTQRNVHDKQQKVSISSNLCVAAQVKRNGELKEFFWFQQLPDFIVQMLHSCSKQTGR